MSAIKSLRSITNPETAAATASSQNQVASENKKDGASRINKSTTAKTAAPKSLKEVAENMPAPKNEVKSDKKPLSERISQLTAKGAEYLKEVRDRAIEDKKQGIKPIEGSRAYLNELIEKAEGYARAGQDQIIDQFATETGNLIADSISGTKVEEYISGLLPSASSGGKTSGAASALAAAGDDVAVQAGKNSVLSGTATKTIGKLGGALSAAYSMYQLWENQGKDGVAASAMNGGTAGAYIGTMIAPGIGTVIGGVIGAIGGAALGYFGSKGKHPEHEAREKMRDKLKEAGFLDKNYALGLANGERFSIAIDGKKKLENMDGSSRHGYQFDPSNKLSGPAIGMLQPLARVMTGGDQKLATDLTSYLANAAISNATNLTELRENVIAIYEQSKLGLETVALGVDELHQAGKIDEHLVEAYAGGLMSVADQSILEAISGGSVDTKPASPVNSKPESAPRSAEDIESSMVFASNDSGVEERAMIH